MVAWQKPPTAEESRYTASGYGGALFRSGENVFLLDRNPIWMTPAEHEKLMKRFGVNPEQERQWHKAQKTGEGESPAEPVPEGDPVNPFAIGGGFLEYCVRQGWLIRHRRGRATKYYVTEAGRVALAGVWNHQILTPVLGSHPLPGLSQKVYHRAHRSRDS
jgi:hypothetical protein